MKAKAAAKANANAAVPEPRKPKDPSEELLKVVEGLTSACSALVENKRTGLPPHQRFPMKSTSLP